MAALIYVIIAALLGTSQAGGAIEKGLSDQLRGTLGPSAKVKVDVDRGGRLSRNIDEITMELSNFTLRDSGGAESIRFRPGKRAVGARIGRISVTARNFTVIGLPVQQMRASIGDLKYNVWRAATKRQLEILDVGPCDGEVTLNERGINRFATPKIRELSDCKITLLNRQVRVSGWYKTKLGVSAPVSLTASLQPRQGQVHLVNPHLKASVVPLPSFIAQRVVRQVNPVIDLNQGSQLPVSVRITQIRLRPGQLWARASISLRPLDEPAGRASAAVILRDAIRTADRAPLGAVEVTRAPPWRLSQVAISEVLTRSLSPAG